MVGLSELQIRDIGLFLPMFAMALTQFEYQGGASPNSWHKFQLPSPSSANKSSMRDRQGHNQSLMMRNNGSASGGGRKVRGPPPLIPSNRVLFQNKNLGNSGRAAGAMYINPNHAEYFEDSDELGDFETTDDFEDEMMASLGVGHGVPYSSRDGSQPRHQAQFQAERYMKRDHDGNFPSTSKSSSISGNFEEDYYGESNFMNFSFYILFRHPHLIKFNFRRTGGS